MKTKNKKFNISIIFAILISIILIFDTLHAQRQFMVYSPKGKIVKILYKGVTFITDTTVLLKKFPSFINFGPDVKPGKASDLIRQRIKESDTKEAIIENDDDLYFYLDDDHTQKRRWDIDYMLMTLMDAGKIEIIDKKDMKVKVLKKEESGSEFRGKVTTQYINPKDDEVVFERVINYRKK